VKATVTYQAAGHELDVWFPAGAAAMPQSAATLRDAFENIPSQVKLAVAKVADDGTVTAIGNWTLKVKRMKIC